MQMKKERKYFLIIAIMALIVMPIAIYGIFTHIPTKSPDIKRDTCFIIVLCESFFIIVFATVYIMLSKARDSEDFMKMQAAYLKRPLLRRAVLAGLAVVGVVGMSFFHSKIFGLVFIGLFLMMYVVRMIYVARLKIKQKH